MIISSFYKEKKTSPSFLLYNLAMSQKMLSRAFASMVVLFPKKFDTQKPIIIFIKRSIMDVKGIHMTFLDILKG